MGMFLPCVLAVVLNATATLIFRDPAKVSNGPLMASYMFLFTAFLLLWGVKLYPRNLRRVGKFQFVIEFLVTEFVMEHLIIDFWFPLEKFILDSLPALAQQIEDCLAAGEWNADPVIEFLRSETCAFAVSYTISTFFLIAALHASRVCDLRTLTQEGPRCFFKEIIHRVKLQTRRMARQLGFGKKKVKINENKNTTQSGDYCRSSSRKSNDSCKSNKSSKKDDDPCSLSFLGKSKKIRKTKNDHAKVNKYCPLHNPCPNIGCDGNGDCSLSDDDFDDLDDFEDLGKFSDLEC